MFISDYFGRITRRPSKRFNCIVSLEPLHSRLWEDISSARNNHLPKRSKGRLAYRNACLNTGDEVLFLCSLFLAVPSSFFFFFFCFFFFFSFFKREFRLLCFCTPISVSQVERFVLNYPQEISVCRRFSRCGLSRAALAEFFHCHFLLLPKLNPVKLSRL